MSTEKPIKYVKHPLSAEDKQAIIKDGFKIVDIAFAPKDAEPIEDKPAKKRATKSKA